MSESSIRNNRHGFRLGDDYALGAHGAGWIDARAGLPYRSAYETMSREDQLNYELGRYRAKNVRLAFGFVPVVPDDVMISFAAVRVGRSVSDLN